MADEPAQVRAHVWVKGRVQAVGFRMFVESAARKLTLTGWVRNVGRDTVEAVAEGERANVDALIAQMKQGPRGARVDEARVEWEDVTGEFEEFGAGRSFQG